MIEASIVRPVRHKNSPALGPLAMMASNVQDLAEVCKAWAPQGGLARRGILNSKIFYAPRIPAGASATGPIIGAPYAVMILESLVAWGGRRIVYLGWCGALSETLGIGDLLLPTQAIVDEGTSPAYGLSPGQSARPHGQWQDFVGSAVDTLDFPVHRGAVWSTDAVYRETPSRVAHFTARGALAVEMEVSALYAAAEFLQVQMAVVLVVSDSLASGSWHPGFRAPRFVQTRQRLCRRIGRLLQDPSLPVD